MIDKMREREIKRNYERLVIDKMRETRREREGERETFVEKVFHQTKPSPASLQMEWRAS